MENRSKIEAIRHRLNHDEITYEQAKVLMQPIINTMNVKGAKIAKEYGKKFRPFTFGYLMR